MYEEWMEMPAEHAPNVFGEFDSYLKKIEKTLQVETVERDGELKITGRKERVDRAVLVLKQLLELSWDFPQEDCLQVDARRADTDQGERVFSARLLYR